MLDTIILTLPIADFRIINTTLFTPNAQGIRTAPYIPRIRGVRECKQYPTQADTKAGNYKPRLSYTSRWDGKRETLSLKMEFSIPKLLWSNNYDELSDEDFPQVLETLENKLLEMGVRVSAGKLEKAVVSTIHYGKNIVLSDYTSVNYVLSMIAKTNISHRFDTAQSDYGNGGGLFRMHTKSFQIVLYDKIADLKKSQSRGVEKDSREINYQMSIFDEIRTSEIKKHKSFDVLRMEIRFMNKVKLKSIFAKLKIPHGEPFTFQQAFCMEHAREIVKYHWDQMRDELKTLECREITAMDRFARVLQYSQDLTPTTSYAVAMLWELTVNEDFRTIRAQFEAKYNPRSLTRLREKLKEIQGAGSTEGYIGIIDRALKKYQPLKIKDYSYTGVNSNQL